MKLCKQVQIDEDTRVCLMQDTRDGDFEVHRVWDGTVEHRRRFDTPDAALSAFNEECAQPA